MADLRLLPAAATAWAAAWWVTGPGSGAPGLVAGPVALVVVALVLARLVHVRPRHAVPGAARLGLDVRGPGRAGLPHATLAHATLAAAGLLAVLISGHVHLAGRAPVAAIAASGVTATLTGTVVSEPAGVSYGHAQAAAQAPAGSLGAVVGTSDQRWALAVRAITARGVTTSARAQVEVTAPAGGDVAYGSEVVVTGRLRPAEPGDPEAARLGATAVAAEPPAGLHHVTAVLRSALLAVTDDLSSQARGLVPGAAIGDTSRVPPELDDAMLVSGLTHVTAVSGSHFAIVVAVLTALAATARLPRAGRVLLVAVAAGGFVALVRPEPSVLRAAAMTALALAGTSLGRPSQAVPALGATILALLVVDPWLSRSFGFALSATATAGLVLLTAPLAARLTPWTGGPLAFALAVPVAAQLACGPVLVLLDPSVSAVSVVANLLAAPALVPATLLGLTATLLSPWLPALAHAVAWAAGGATWWIAEVAVRSAALPGARLPWLAGVAGSLLLAGLTLVALWALLRRGPRSGWPEAWRYAARSGVRRAVTARRRSSVPRRIVAGSAVVAIVVVIVVAIPRVLRPAPEIPPDWQVVACDVGQGDGLVLRSGPQSAVVVDVGPDGDAVGRCLDSLGVTRIDLLVLSHYHADHVGGLPAVLAGRDVAAALVSPLDAPAANAEWVLGTLADAAVPVQVAAAGDRGTTGSAAWEVLLAGLPGARDVGDPGTRGEAPASGGEGGDGANDASVVLAVSTADLDVVLLGDLEDAGQAALLGELRGRGAGAVDVVKVAHHGSREQSDGLAELLDPAVAVVSSGEGNTYGHPTDAALDLYEGVGAAVVRTDECGTFALVVRGGTVSLAGC
ncbi:ComEC/Rec2 family competence protein [Antribacter gilvus]|uniref:ComEC/Rec2 family competence protein n=1 Tax=Antribacter gilvus TaxID=2304675 RepID=UPI000F7775BF|nr:ComEC/Rec2 family competence protein [Antribacter gilvus]